MKPTRFTKIGLAALGAALVLWLVLMLVSGGESKTAAARGDGKHCPSCGRELPKSAIVSGECPYCALEHGPEKAKFRRDSSAVGGPVIPVALGSLLAVLLVVHLVIVVRNRKDGTEDEILYYVRCRKCGRKLRYRPKQAGHVGKCPLCQKPIMFPRPEEDPRPNKWVKIVHAIWG